MIFLFAEAFDEFRECTSRLAVGLAIIGVLASVVGAFYYLRIVKVMYFDQPEEGLDGPISFEMKSILVVMGVVILLFIFLPGPLLSGAEAASAALSPG